LTNIKNLIFVPDPSLIWTPITRESLWKLRPAGGTKIIILTI
jgi:hypothetical protein